jgi:hypothetical protein
MKTTNAKAKVFQTPAGPETDRAPEKTQLKPTSTRPLRQKISHVETVKLEIHGDEPDPLEEREPEYCAPKVQELPYENEDFPDGCLDYSIVKGANQTRAFYQNYYNPIGPDGLSKKEREFEEELQRHMKETDEKIMKAVEEDPCIVHDVPETYPTIRKRPATAHQRAVSVQISKTASALPTKGPATITSRRAASALALAAKASASSIRTTVQVPLTKKPTSFLRSKKETATTSTTPTPSTMRHASAAAASRSTIGYTKGRTASSVLNMGFDARPEPRPAGLPLLRSVSNCSTASDSTITPARWSQKQDEEEYRKLKFLGAFDVDDDDLGVGSGLPECLRGGEEEDEEEFVMTLNL